MEILYLYLRLLLAAVFSIAAAGKLFDFRGSEKSVMEFGVPASLAKVVALCLPVVEIAIAVMLIDMSWALVGSFGAATLLSAFTIGMVFQKVKGNAPDCHCFGAVGSEPVGTSTIVRNLVLLSFALSIIFSVDIRRGGSLFEQPAILIAPLVASSVLPVIVLVLFSYANGLKRKTAELVSKVEILEGILMGESDGIKENIGHPDDGIPVGAPIPPSGALSVLNIHGRTLSQRLAEGDHVVVFVGPECGPCAAMLPDLISLRDEFDGRLQVSLISEGEMESNSEKFGDFGLESLFIQHQKQISSLFLAKWTPMAVLISRGRVASRVAAGEANIRKLFEFQNGRDFSSETLFTPTGIPRSRYRIGEELPDFSIYTVEGESIRNNHFAPAGGLIIFTNASCTHCDVVTDTVIRLRDRNNGLLPDGFRFLFLNSDDPTKLIQRGLADATSVDEGHVLGKRFGAFGTPSAILVDTEGKIASETAVGSVAIDALLGIYGGSGGR